MYADLKREKEGLNTEIGRLRAHLKVDIDVN